MTYEHISWLKNLGKQVKDGGISIEEAFPEPEKPGEPGASPADDLASKLAAKASLSPDKEPTKPAAPKDERDEWLAALHDQGFSDAQIFAALKIKGRDEMTPEHIAALVDMAGFVNAKKTTWADALGIKTAAGPAAKKGGGNGGK